MPLQSLACCLWGSALFLLLLFFLGSLIFLSLRFLILLSFSKYDFAVWVTFMIMINAIFFSLIALYIPCRERRKNVLKRGASRFDLNFQVIGHLIVFFNCSNWTCNFMGSVTLNFMDFRFFFLTRAQQVRNVFTYSILNAHRLRTEQRLDELAAKMYTYFQ